MPISCQFRDCKALLSTSPSDVKNATASTDSFRLIRLTVLYLLDTALLKWLSEHAVQAYTTSDSAWVAWTTPFLLNDARLQPIVNTVPVQARSGLVCFNTVCIRVS